MAQRDPIGKAPEASHQSFPTHPAAITMGQEGLIGGHGRVRQLESFFVGTWKKQSRSDCSLPVLRILRGNATSPKPALDSCTLTLFKQLLFLLRTLYHIIELFGLLKFSVVLHCQLYLKHVASNIPRVFF